MDWDNAPVNPVGFTSQCHYKLNGDINGKQLVLIPMDCYFA
jgi:hypothetical protein